MDTTLQTTIVIAVFILISLLAFFAIILSCINWLNLRKSLRSFSDLPQRLCLPLTMEERDTMKSWYIDREEARGYLGKLSVEGYPPARNANLMYAGNIPGTIKLKEAGLLSPCPGNGLKLLSSRAGRALQNPEASVRESPLFIFQVNEAIQYFERDPEGKDELPGIKSSAPPVKNQGSGHNNH